MSVPILPVELSEIVKSGSGSSPKQSEALKHSFESVLQEWTSKLDLQASSTAQTEQNVNKIQPNQLNVESLMDLLPDFIDTKTRLRLIEGDIDKISGTSQGFELGELFSKIEREWFKVEDAMKSDKNPSRSELVKLQVQLYTVSEHLGVLTKVVDQVATSLKTVLNTAV